MLELIGKAMAAINPTPIDPLTVGEVGSNPTTFVTRIFSWLLYVGGALAVGYLIYGGILYITAGGDEEKATKGKTAVVNAVIGIVVILLALAIIEWVKYLVKTSQS